MIELCLAILNPTANQIYGECGVQRGSGAFAVPGLLKNKNENSGWGWYQADDIQQSTGRSKMLIPLNLCQVSWTLGYPAMMWFQKEELSVVTRIDPFFRGFKHPQQTGQRSTECWPFRGKWPWHLLVLPLPGTKRQQAPHRCQIYQRRKKNRGNPILNGVFLRSVFQNIFYYIFILGGGKDDILPLPSLKDLMASNVPGFR